MRLLTGSQCSLRRIGCKLWNLGASKSIRAAAFRMCLSLSISVAGNPHSRLFHQSMREEINTCTIRSIVGWSKICKIAQWSLKHDSQHSVPI